MNRLVFLHSVDLFKPFSLDELRLIEGEMEALEEPAGAVLFKEGDSANLLYIISEGSVEISISDDEGGHTVLTELAERQYFGEMALFDDAPRSATARTLTHCRLLSLDKRRFVSLINQHP